MPNSVDHKSRHLAYIKEKGSFQINCSTKIFNPEEIEILKKYGHWFQALGDGTLTPYTDGQRRLVRVIQNEEPPQTIHEKAWFKYLGRLRIEAQYGESLHAQYEPEDDTFYNREMAKKVRSTMFKVTRENHRKG